MTAALAGFDDTIKTANNADKAISILFIPPKVRDWAARWFPRSGELYPGARLHLNSL